MAIVAGAAASMPLAQGTAWADTPSGGPTGGWLPVTTCESNNRANATNNESTASGAWQFLDSSWIMYGGGRYSHRALNASYAQQNAIANRAFAQDGLTPWAASKHCWGAKIAAVAKHAAPAPKPAPVRSAMYTVRPGDSLSSIAAAHGTTWQALFAANRNKIRNPRLILPGLLLNLPKG
jgi:resuscitation-promoting factor RpfA